VSFASLTKKELTNSPLKECCLRAELAALIRMNGTLSISSRRVTVEVRTENAAIARRIFISVKQLFKVAPELLVRKKNAPQKK